MADRDQIKRHVEQYRTKVAEIRADKTLSPLGKRRALEAAYEQTKAAVDPLRAEVAEHETTSRRALERRLFGVSRAADPSEVIAYRDAQDRVARVNSPQALGDLMERAASTGDETLLRAAAQHAWAKSRGPLASADWDTLVGEYARQNPATARDLEQFNEMHTTRGQTAQFAERLSMTVSPPDELRVPEARLSDDAPPKVEQPSVFGRA